MDPSKFKASRDEIVEKIRKGFKIISMNMCDYETKEVFWSSDNCSNYHDSEEEIKAEMSKKLLSSKVVSREIKFYSEEKIQKLRLVQYVYFNDQIAETFQFKFGFVIPQSTNTWQQILDAAEEMIPADLLSGNLVVLTQFFDDETFICSSKFRIYYV